MNDDDDIEVRRISEVRTFVSRTDPPEAVIRIEASGQEFFFSIALSEYSRLATDFANNARLFGKKHAGTA
tara:strand:- start:12378 stop:12587 length:210 start_codon:yes stop_codon:yes gene_type:complete